MTLKLRKNKDFGYYHLHPIPSQEDIESFYSNYTELIKTGEKDQGMMRLMFEGKEQVKELHWMEHTVYQDVKYMIETYASTNKPAILDCGAGNGDLVEYLSNHFLNTLGIDPYFDSRSNLVFRFSIDNVQNKSTDVLLLMNVLEHIREPFWFINEAKKTLREEGLIIVKVPNEFNRLQVKALKFLKTKPWFISTKDIHHINYFNLESLTKLLDASGFDVFDAIADFPMEAFLLSGYNYVDNQDIGSFCHQSRVSMEMAVNTEVRRKLYQLLAKSGIGRTVLVAGVLK